MCEAMIKLNILLLG